jgi:hypothetical protein
MNQAEHEESLKQFERMVADFDPFQHSTNTSDCCSLGFHKWRHYTGFNIEHYYYCERCDEKDYKTAPPPGWNR